MYFHLGFEISWKAIEIVALGVVTAGGAYMLYELMKEDEPETAEINPIN